MKIDVLNWGGETVGELELSDEVFGLEPRRDVLHRVVRYQLAKRQQGTHKVKTKSEVSYSTKKIYRQKGTGGARHGSRRAPIFRKGGIYKGPTPRSHAHDLNKKFRKLGMRHALSAKVGSGDLIVVDAADLAEAKTKAFVQQLNGLGVAKALIVDAEVSPALRQASGNVADVDVLPQIGANVYDILRRDKLVLTRAAVEALQARLLPGAKPAAPQTEEAPA